MKKAYFFVAVLSSLLLARCQSKEEKKAAIPSKDSIATRMENDSTQLINDSEMLTIDLINAGVIDTNRTPELGETAYADTIIHLNDSVYYAIVHVGDKAGVCSILFITTISKPAQRVIESRYLYPDCDIDFSADTYDYIGHRIVAPNNIVLTRTTVYQKKDRKPGDESANIERQEQKHTYLIVSAKGELVFDEEEEH